MKVRSLLIVICLLVSALAVFGQTDRGTITGTIADATGAVIPGATVEAKNVGTGTVYTAGSSETGNLIAKESVALIAPAVVLGNVQTPSLSIAEGAVLDGKLKMLDLDKSSAGSKGLSLRDVAQYLEVEAKVVEDWANQRKIPGEFQNGEWRFNQTAVDKWLQDEKVKK